MALLMLAVGGATYWMNGDRAVEPLRLRRVPLLAAACCFAAGDVAAQRLHGGAALFVVTGVLAVLLALRWAARWAPAVVLGLWVLVGCWCAQMQPAIGHQEALTKYADGLSRSVRGRVVRVRELKPARADDALPLESTEPGAWEVDHADAMESVDIEVQAVEEVTPDVSWMQPVQGGARVAVLADDAGPDLRCGDVLEMPLRMRVPDSYRDPGAWSYADQLLSEGIGVQASVKAEKVRRVSAGSATWRCRLYAAQAWAGGRMQAYVQSRANESLPQGLRLNEQDAAMLNAMLFGDRSGLTQSLRAGFERTGTFHLFVVSGMHIALLAGAVFWMLRRLRVWEGAAVAVTIAVTTAYALLTGFGAPVQRALCMTAVFLLARWLARESGVLNALGAAALVVLAMDPRALFEAGFQMTFLVIVAVGGLAAPLMKWMFGRFDAALHGPWETSLDVMLHPRVAQLRVRLRMFGVLLAALMGKRARDLPFWMLRLAVWCGELLLVGVVTEICMALPMAVYFHRATLLALPANFVALPMVGLLMAAAVALFVLSMLSTWAAAVPGLLVGGLLHSVNAAIAHLGRVADVRVPEPGAWEIAAACGAMAFCCWALATRRKAWRIAGVVMLAAIPLTVLWPEKPLLHAGVMEVTALDVGQGDSLLVVSPEGKTLLVDAGGPVGQAASAERWDVGEEVVAPYLWSRKIRRLDAVLLTHAHSDHMGGMAAVLRDLRPKQLWLSVAPGRSAGLRALLAEARELGVEVRWFYAGDAFAWGGLQADVLAPEVGYANPGGAVNDDSLVMRLSYGKASALLEGDAQAASEAAMLAHARVSQTTLLKVGHHGSITSTTPGFLAAVAPRDAVISVGRRNTFGHPRAEVLQRLQASGAMMFRTDRDGAETFLLDSRGGISASAATSHE